MKPGIVRGEGEKDSHVNGEKLSYFPVPAEPGITFMARFARVLTHLCAVKIRSTEQPHTPGQRSLVHIATLLIQKMLDMANILLPFIYREQRLYITDPVVQQSLLADALSYGAADGTNEPRQNPAPEPKYGSYRIHRDNYILYINYRADAFYMYSLEVLLVELAAGLLYGCFALVRSQLISMIVTALHSFRRQVNNCALCRLVAKSTMYQLLIRWCAFIASTPIVELCRRSGRALLTRILAERTQTVITARRIRNMRIMEEIVGGYLSGAAALQTVIQTEVTGRTPAYSLLAPATITEPDPPSDPEPRVEPFSPADKCSPLPRPISSMNLNVMIVTGLLPDLVTYGSSGSPCR